MCVSERERVCVRENERERDREREVLLECVPGGSSRSPGHTCPERERERLVSQIRAELDRVRAKREQLKRF